MPRIPVPRGLVYSIYERRLRSSIDRQHLPGHVAMIIDGNRRWARQWGHPTVSHGHRAGAAKVLEFLGWCDAVGVKVVTLYLLSADNLVHRDSDELRDLTRIIASLAAAVAARPGWRVQHVGSTAGLPEHLTTALTDAETATAERTGLHVNFAVGYGGRSEIADAMRSIVAQHHLSGGSLEELATLLTPDLISEHLYTQGQPDPDLIIRTSGEQRLSDFMLWQSAHSELYFVEALGPDIREVDLLRALRDYARRQRRFGA